jgi:predicted transposase YbfD/YdcC
MLSLKSSQFTLIFISSKEFSAQRNFQLLKTIQEYQAVNKKVINAITSKLQVFFSKYLRRKFLTNQQLMEVARVAQQEKVIHVKRQKRSYIGHTLRKIANNLDTVKDK